MGRECRLLVIDSPMSSAKALRVEVGGNGVVSWWMRMSRPRTNRVGDIGHPCLTPERMVIEGNSYPPMISWCWLFWYRSLIALMKLVGTPMCCKIFHINWWFMLGKAAEKSKRRRAPNGWDFRHFLIA